MEALLAEIKELESVKKQPLPILRRYPKAKPKFTEYRPGNSLYMQRVMRAMSQADLASKAGTSRRTVSAIENNHSAPSVYLAIAIAEALELSVQDIFRLHKK